MFFGVCVCVCVGGGGGGGWWGRLCIIIFNRCILIILKLIIVCSYCMCPVLSHYFVQQCYSIATSSCCYSAQPNLVRKRFDWSIRLSGHSKKY